MATSSVPIKLLHEAKGQIVTCESNVGVVYRGKLKKAEENMSCLMTNVTVTFRDGKTSNFENVYLRGSQIRFFILPDIFKYAPMLKGQGSKAPNAGVGHGKSAIPTAQVAQGRSRPGLGQQQGRGRLYWQGPGGSGGNQTKRHQDYYG